MEDLQHIINSKRELLERETFSRNPINYSEGMPEDQKDRYIRYLAEQLRENRLTMEAMKLVLKDFKDELSETKEQRKASEEALHRERSEYRHELSELRRELSGKDARLLAAERKVRELQEQLDYARQGLFGGKRQRIRKKGSKGKPEKPEPDRRDEQDGFDGTEESLRTDSVGEGRQESQPAPAKERDLSNRPDSYKTMSLGGNPVFHPSDPSKVPGRILERKTVKVFSLKTCLVEEHFELVHYVEPGKKPKWGYFPSAGHPETVTRFEGTSATPEFLQAIAYEVYVKNVTFGLLHQWLRDMGMTISANTLHNWLKKGKKYLDRLVLVLKEMALEKDSIVNCDETWCKVRKYDHYKKCYIWVLVNKGQRVAVFFYEDGSRGRDVLTDFLGDAELKSIMTDGYNAYVFIGDGMKSAKFKNTIHQVCMAHGKNKFVKAHNQGHEPMAAEFDADFSEIYSIEAGCDKAGLSPEERLHVRQSLRMKEIVIRMRSRLDSELAKADPFRSKYYQQALNYLKKFWNEIFAFLQDGNLPIDNNLAERTIRKLTTQRNNALHYGSDAGVEMAGTYHSVISTVKMHGCSAWDYIVAFFKKIFNGDRDYGDLVPGKIALTS